MVFHTKSKNIIKFIFWVLVIGIFICLLNKLYKPVIRNYLFLKREQAKLLQQKNNILSDKENMEKTIRNAEEDIGLEKSARLELNMKKEGEGVIFVSETTTTKIENKTSSILWWERIKDWFGKKK